MRHQNLLNYLFTKIDFQKLTEFHFNLNVIQKHKLIKYITVKIIQH